MRVIDTLQEIKRRIENDGFSITRHFHVYYPDVARYLNEKYPNIKNMSEKFLVEITPIEEYTCSYGKQKGFSNLKDGFSKFCGKRTECICFMEDFKKKSSITHANMSPERKKSISAKRVKTFKNNDMEVIQAKREATMMERYGVSNALHSEIIKEKIKETNRKKYGSDWGMCSSQFRDKLKELFMEKYGVDHPMKVEEIRQKMINTNIKNYGFSNPMQNESIKEKTKETNLSKYGTEYIGHRSPIIRTKIRNTLIEKYGVDNPSQIVEFQEKRKATNIEKYGAENPITLWSHGTGETSSYEEQIKDLLDTHNIGYLHNNRTVIPPKELDFYIPDKKVAIEFCGIYWHSELAGNKGNKYHYEKWKKCNELDIDLYTIFEDEYRNKPDFWNNKILYAIGAIQLKRIYARNCEVKFIDNANNFLEENHVQGKVTSSSTCGLFHDGNLVAVMTFGNPRNNDKDTIELSRFCSKSDTHIIGGASKLLSFFIANTVVKNIISFSDNRYSNGKVYNSLGFKLANDLLPDYKYTNDYRTLFHKALFRKSSIQKKFQIDPEYINTLTEWELMQLLGYDRIWDCGKKKWSLIGD